MAKCLTLRKDHLHNDFILLPRPESFRISFSCANFKYEGKKEKDSGHISKKNDAIMQMTFSKDANLQQG